MPRKTQTTTPTRLRWEECGGFLEATIGDFEGGDGVRFTRTHHPTCYRRGPHKLLIEVAEGRNHFKWGCFDAQDQPVRWYHDPQSLLREADIIAGVLLTDRAKA